MRIHWLAIFIFCFGLTMALAQQTKAGADKADTNPPKSLDQSEQQFLKDASIGNMAEVELGQLAEQKASASEVKQFAERMTKDHSAVEDQLKNVASSQHVSLPTELDAKHKNAKASVSKLSGSEFDRAYMTLMVQEHTQDVQKFQQQSTSASDQTVKQLAGSTLPTLQDHLKEAKQIEAGIQKGSIK